MKAELQYLCDETDHNRMMPDRPSAVQNPPGICLTQLTAATPPPAPPAGGYVAMTRAAVDSPLFPLCFDDDSDDEEDVRGTSQMKMRPLRIDTSRWPSPCGSHCTPATPSTAVFDDVD